MDFSIAYAELCNVKETKYIGVSEEVPDNMQTHPSATERNSSSGMLSRRHIPVLESHEHLQQSGVIKSEA